MKGMGEAGVLEGKLIYDDSMLHKERKRKKKNFISLININIILMVK